MEGIQCPFCGKAMPDIRETHQARKVAFEKGYTGRGMAAFDEEYAWSIDMVRCPACGKIRYIALGEGEAVNEKRVFIFPESDAKEFPDYIPVGIRNDYTEACGIRHKSPKAAATLARRCLQGMIRDFWIVTGKKNLFDEIDAIKDSIPAAQWKAIDAVRKIGNIGAHMEKDVDLIIDVEPEEAEKLLRLIELLMEKWYIARHDEEELYREITDTGDAKTAAKHPAT